MISAQIESLFKMASAHHVTEIFIWVIFIIFSTACYSAWRRGFTVYVKNAPTLMTSLGILGTFIGIVIGLLHFDTANIDGSIPALLEGLKTAFITSVIGLLAAILFNSLNSALFSKRRQEQTSLTKEDITPADIYTSLEAQRENTANLYQGLVGGEEGSLIGQIKILRADLSSLGSQQRTLTTIEEKLQLLCDGITGTEEGSLIGQLKLLRVENQEQLVSLNRQITDFSSNQEQRSAAFEEKLFTALNEFADMMSRAATEQIIEALKDVITEFNNKLTEQFGENFKALDESVKKLVVWQEQYKNHVEVMSDQYKQSVESLVDTRQAVAGIWQECENIPRTMQELKDVLEVNQHQIAELQRHLEAFLQMRDAAVEAVPTIKGQLDLIGDHLTSSTAQVQERLHEVSEDLLRGSNEMRVSLAEGAEHFRDSVSTTQQAFNELSSNVQKASEELSSTMDDMATDFNTRTRETLDTMSVAQASMQEHVNVTVESLAEHTRDITATLSGVSTNFEQTSERVLETIKNHTENTVRESSNLLEQARATLNEHLNEAARQTGNTINKQLEQLEKATVQEIETAMETMGRSLVAITGRFVNDYQQMTEAMEQVVHMANRQSA